MLITFTTDAYEAITYFDKVAQRLLGMMGHSGAVPGAIVAEDIPEALTRLQQSIEREEAMQMDHAAPSNDNEEEEEREISLTHRALPLINLLKAAEKKKCNVIWEYQ